MQIQDIVMMRVDREKDKDIKRADEEVMAIPQYNKPKKTNNANVLPQGETSEIRFFYTWELNNVNMNKYLIRRL